MISTTSQTFFDQKYRENADPWNFTTSDYELGRYRTILAALENRRFRYAVEPGCSIGVLTSQLATICDAISAFDLSPTAVETARARCAHFPHVTISCQSFHSCHPRGADLFVLSEIGYYFSVAELTSVLNRCFDEIAPSATVLACHWLGDSSDHVLRGDEVHDVICQAPELKHEFGERHRYFRIDRWRKNGVRR
jgi:predicted TPR repeat methyltransferase